MHLRCAARLVRWYGMNVSEDDILKQLDEER